MQTIMKVIVLFISAFVILNGFSVFYYPPAGDEAVGTAIIIFGIIIPLFTFLISGRDRPIE